MTEHDLRLAVAEALKKARHCIDAAITEMEKEKAGGGA